MKKFFVLAMMLSFLAGGWAPCFAGADGAKSRLAPGMRCISKWQMFKFFRDLDITAEQRASLKELKEQTDNQSEALLAQIADVQEQIHDTVLASEIDAAAAESLIDDMLLLQNQLAGILLHAELQAAQILSADQRALIRDMIEQLRQCAEARPGWKHVQKPSYFSLIMPDNRR